MAKKNWIKLAKKRIKSGESFDKVVNDISKHVSKKELEQIIENLISGNKTQKPIMQSYSPLLYSKSITVIAVFILVIVSIPVIAMINNQLMNEKWKRFDATKISDPVQVSSSETPIFLEHDNYQIKISPLAKYKVSALVASKKRYSDPEELSPFDFVLVWGDIANPDYGDDVSFSQNNRMYFYRYNADSPYNSAYISSHSANTHMIPANDNILAGFNRVSRNEIVFLEGYLVNIEMKHFDRTKSWSTSTTRKDTGMGSCEIFYVERLVINEKTYA